MLIIRRPQMERLQADLLERWTFAHLQRHFPARCRRLGPAALTRLVHDNLVQARTHGFGREAHLCRYVQLALLLGDGFDNDPALPWAAKLLRCDRDPATRIELLQAAAADFIRDGPPVPDEDDGEDDDSEAADEPLIDPPDDPAAFLSTDGGDDDDDDDDDDEDVHESNEETHPAGPLS